MDLLKEELKRKREALASETGGKKLFKRSELEQRRIQKLREEEKRQSQLKSTKSTANNPSSPNPPPSNPPSHQNPNDPPIKSDSKTPDPPKKSEEQKIDELVLPRQEVVRRLRFLKQPVTIFGEDDEARLERLKFVLKAGAFEVDDTDMTEGQTNDFLRDIVELKKRQRSGIVSERRKKGKGKGGEGCGEEGGGGEEGEGGGEGEGSGEGGEDGEDSKRMKADFEELCGEDRILVFFKRLLNEWSQELDDTTTEAKRRTAKGKQMQCARYLTPLFKFCRKKILPDDIRQALLVVVECCMKRDYLAAMDQYIKLAIGNAPWPIGVTMVGIHERSAREKIYTNSVAHIMNDETTRKYLQSVKRLMTFCQRKYPAMPSKAVEFNSLANGSDLQSLLAEENAMDKNQGSDVKLRLMPA
ncbi:hypothetical protein Scep_009483 [Stephania cephalantha]|uniref:Pre-mRNA-splicing factor 18 n=1 Tax=Stephania cephalantha TaxID=152367 RepID=A0AAP0JVR2_9MAGN